ncbi:MAG: hypothetical protein LBH85_06055 [Treponema sp.]|jgi:hypothetical protein|nr:hypothetical protein [Treponema sp.]
MGFLTAFDAIAKSIQGLFGGLLMIMCVGGILTLAVLLTIKKIDKPIAVIAQALGSCILMIPVMWGLNNFVEAKVGAVDQRDKIRERERKIDELQGKIRQIEGAGFNLQQFEKILKVGLVETKLRQTYMTKNIFDTSHRADFFFPYDWEYLGVMTNNVTATFGIDLKLVRLYNSGGEENTIVAYGIKPAFMGALENNPFVEISEIRQLMLDGNLDVKETKIDNSSQAKNALIKQERDMMNAYQSRLNKGLQTDFMDDSVVKLAESFIKMILAPLGKEITFSEEPHKESFPLEEFLQMEMDVRKRELELLKSQ